MLLNMNSKIVLQNGNKQETNFTKWREKTILDKNLKVFTIGFNSS
jgi:hypothetical protein